MIEIVDPPTTIAMRPFGGNSVAVVGIGKCDSPYSWSLKEIENPVVFERERLVREALGQLAQEYKVHTIGAPSPINFNAEVCAMQDLTTSVELPGEATLLRGIYADALELDNRGQAFVISSADCLTIIIRDKTSGMVVVGHGGRKSLIDEKMLEWGVPSRKYESVIQGMLSKFNRNDREKLQAYLCFGIAPHNFAHPWNHRRFGEKNKTMVNYIIDKWGSGCVAGEPEIGCIDLKAVATAQLRKEGLLQNSITYDGVNTFSREWHSQRRDAGILSAIPGRNLVFVARTE